MNSLVGPRSASSSRGRTGPGNLRIRKGLKIRTKLLLLVGLLLVIPWMGYESVREMEKFLLAGQEQALELTTQGISSILGNRTDLFDPEVGVPELIGRPLTSLLSEITEPLAIDAPPEIWASAVGPLTHFSGSGLFECGPGYRPDSLIVRHGLALNQDAVFAFFEIDDDVVVYRDPALLSLDTNDQIRITIQRNDGEILRYLLTAQEPGRFSVYLMRANWRDVVDGQALRDISGSIEPLGGGYAAKLRIPRDLLGVGARLKFEIVDVDNPDDRAVAQVISTEPDPGSYEFGSVRLVTPELAKLIQPLYISEANITVWDQSYRVRAQIGAIIPPAREAFGLEQNKAVSIFQALQEKIIQFFDWILRSPTRGLADMPDESSTEDQRILARVLSEGEPSTERRRYGEAKLIVTASPIWAQGEVEGVVLVKQSANKLLALQYNTLQRFTILFLAVFLFLAFAILIFSTRLTYRVGRLQRETEQATSSEGRLLKDRIRAGARSSDELGSLTRSISSMLHNLGQYTRYLERLPDTLAHELHNPLNVVNSSLENLQYHHAELSEDKHLQRARNGIGRLRSIITSLTEAASLKEALSQEQEQLERFDLCSLLQNCVDGYQAANPGHRIVATLVPTVAWMHGVPDRVAQLLDKLIDNAIAFGTPNGLIVVNLRIIDNEFEIKVSNDGPALPSEIADSLFDPMVSSARDARKTHLGLGLYIVRLVAEFHKGTVSARNRPGGSGVEILVSLPRDLNA